MSGSGAGLAERDTQLGGVDDERLAELLAAPTLGAVRRARGLDGWDEWGKHAYAVTAVNLALRIAVVDRLGALLDAIGKGASPAVVARRIRQLAEDVAPLEAGTIDDAGFTCLIEREWNR